MMSDENWWNFTIDEEIRKDPQKSRLKGEQEVNPELEGGRRNLHYGSYLSLEELLSCQRPSSMVPDERIFIITHQLCELVFKQVIFDLAVVAETFNKLLAENDEQLLRLCCQDSDFWSPALTASARIKMSSKKMLPMIMTYLGRNEEDTFSSIEYYRFRDNLTPASGFQTAQYRLIQRAFGKSNLLAIRLFPGEAYNRCYRKTDDQLHGKPVKVLDKMILKDLIKIADPQQGPLVQVAKIDEIAHNVLGRLPQARNTSPIRIIHSHHIDDILKSFSGILEKHREKQTKVGAKPNDAEQMDEEAAEIFRNDLQRAFDCENDRRRSLAKARSGSFYLHNVVPGSPISRVLETLRSADLALHGTHEESFLHIHFNMAKARIMDVIQYAEKMGYSEPPSGSGGGGVPYLAYSRMNLIPLFPALVAFCDIEDVPGLSWIE